MTVISDYVCMSSFCVRSSMRYRKRLHGVYISMFCIVVALPINTLRFFNLCFFFIHYETTTKAKFIYLCKREWQLNLKSMKMSWIIKMVKLMIVVQSFNIIVWPRPFLKLIQFKMLRGTYDTLLLISRLNSLLNNTHHKPISFYRIIYHYFIIICGNYLEWFNRIS